ncbi:FBD-associated F-box protein [Rhynchospora pubera]|uniref:FBD-associated F-box protein n=1 Tax=Rhynchospora pubera TaxID=906938 RepID=A0AAV8EYC1_9POAL|nr:FBD-associated F-box protein [Rhynchospora pubera]
MTTCTPPVRPNASQKVVFYTGPDRLSALPDVLLYKILSSLDPREVAQTCILSKRWRNLWTSVPCLHFEISDRTTTFSKESCRRFKKMVNAYILSYDEAACLHSFHLSCRGRRYLHKGIADAAPMWIEQAMKHKPNKVQLNFSHYERLRLPDSLYLCSSLEELYIIFHFGVNTIPFEPDEVCLPKLKRLQLRCTSISPDAMKKICYGCPMLESLSLENCLLEKQDVTFGSLKSEEPQPEILLFWIHRFFCS